MSFASLEAQKVSGSVCSVGQTLKGTGQNCRVMGSSALTAYICETKLNVLPHMSFAQTVLEVCTRTLWLTTKGQKQAAPEACRLLGLDNLYQTGCNVYSQSLTRAAYDMSGLDTSP